MEKLKIIIYLFFSIIKFNFCIIVLPFKTYKLPEPSNYTIESIFNSWGKNILYTTLSIGTPPQKIIMTINSNSYGTTLFQHMCDIPISLYNNNESKTFNRRQSVTYFPMVKASIIDETIYFYNNTEMDKLQEYKNFKFIYSDNKKEDQSYAYEYHNYTCINAGLKLNYNLEIEKFINIIIQLAQNFGESYDFTFKYNSNDEVMMIIGAEPHVFEPETYSEKDYRTVGANDKDMQVYRDWHITFDEIYISYKDKNTGNEINKKLNETNKIRIKFDLGVIHGTTDYRNMIKSEFFQKLIDDEKCWEFNNSLQFGYYCDKNKAGSIIKNEFPSLYLKLNQFNKIFELNYNDLFREINDKLYFLVFFSSTYQNYFEIGKIFLKKYTFTFNPDARSIGYYIKTKEHNNDNKPEPEGFFSGKTFIILIVCSIIVFSIIGFFVGKYIYDKMRKKRMNELDDMYEYKPEKDNSEDNSNSITNDVDEGDHLGINEKEENIN